MVTVTGGKWTTYRLMAEHAIDAAIKAADKGREEVGDDNVTTSSAAEDTPKEETTLAAKASPCRTNSVGVVGAHGYTLDLPARLIQLSSRRSASHSGDGGGGGRRESGNASSSSTSTNSSDGGGETAVMVRGGNAKGNGAESGGGVFA